MPKKTNLKNVAKHTPGSAIPPLSLARSPSVSDSAPSSSSSPPSVPLTNQLLAGKILCEDALLDSRLLFPGSRCREVSDSGTNTIENSYTDHGWTRGSKPTVFEDPNSVELVSKITADDHSKDEKFEDLLAKARDNLVYDDEKWAIVAKNSRIWKGKTFKVVDGMHRIVAAQNMYKKGKWSSPLIPVMIVKPFTDAEEAELCQLAFNLNSAQHQIVTTSLYDELCYHQRVSETVAKTKPGKGGNPAKIGFAQVKKYLLNPGDSEGTVRQQFNALAYIREDAVLMKYIKEDCELPSSERRFHVKPLRVAQVKFELLPQSMRRDIFYTISLVLDVLCLRNYRKVFVVLNVKKLMI